MSFHDLDDQTREVLRQLAEKHGWTVEELARVVLGSVPAAADGDPILGLMADEPDLIDKVVDSAYEAREHPLRQPKS